MIVYAVNVHTGGGKILLDALIQNEPFGKISYLYLDERYSPERPIPQNIVVKRYKPTLASRLRAQWDLRRFLISSMTGGPCLFFGNQPPFFKLPCESIVYLQNCFLLKSVPLPKDRFKNLSRMLAERFLLKFFQKNYSQIWVQSKWMVDITKKDLPEKTILRKPFLPNFPKVSEKPKSVDIINVTSLLSYKNLNTFMEALTLLDKTLTRKIKVMVVLDTKSSVDQVDKPNFVNIDLAITSRISRAELFDLYEKSKVAVIGSSFESFCLPLYEAIHFKLQVAALKTPYLDNFDYPLQIYSENTAEELARCLDKTVN